MVLAVENDRMRLFSKFLAVALLLGCSPLQLFGQIGGVSTFQLLDFPTSARAAAMGQYHITTRKGDASLALENPALLNPKMDQHLALSGNSYVSDSKYGSAVYVRQAESGTMMMGGLQHLNYGSFTRANAQGDRLGEFSASETNLTAGAARQSGAFSMGFRFNLIYGSLESFNAVATAMDFGVTYQDTAKLVTASLVADNLGAMLEPYVANQPEPLPLNVQLGVSKRFKHAPFRVTVLAHHLNIPDLTERQTDQQPSLGGLGIENNQESEPSLGDKIFRHMILGGELIFSENFQLRFAYNHQLRQTMATESNQGLVGFSGGVGIGIGKFQVNYGFGSYHLAANTHTLSVSTDLNEIFVSK